ncbi:MAG TPA: VOC family protein [Solirubrobacterales bacterium]|nr:VOC family protein [Solirubrobacterales bacterium]
MRIVSIDHMSFTVSDLDETNAFFGKLGFEPLKRYVSAGPDADEGTETPDANIDISWLAHPQGGPKLELLRYQNQPTGRAAHNSKVGAAHLCIRVEDVTSEYERLSGEEVSFVSAPHEDEFGVVWVYLRDPDGNVVELLQEP